MEYSKNSNYEAESTIAKLTVELQTAAEKLPISPRQLQPEQFPKIRPAYAYSGPELETAYLEDPKQNRILCYGDDHGLIFSFLNKAVKKGIVLLPLRQILNLDFHADISDYTIQINSHCASWQRYGVDKGFWEQTNSYNWQPEYSTAKPLQQFTPERFILSISANQASILSPDILSIDLDFFNDLNPADPKFLEYLKIIKIIIKRSKRLKLHTDKNKIYIT